MAKKKKRKDGSQPREKWTYFVFYEKTKCIKFNVFPGRRDVLIDGKMESAYFEQSYKRKNPEKGSKVLNRIPVTKNSIHPSGDEALKGYDEVWAIDTNTERSPDRKISITGIVVAEWSFDDWGRKEGFSYFTPFCLEFSGLIDGVEEKAGMVMAIEELKKTRANANKKIAVVIDHSLGEIGKINSREKDVIDGYLLPEGLSLVYASSDKPNESSANRLIRIADDAANMIKRLIMEGRIEPVGESDSKRLYRGYRVVVGKNGKEK